MVQLVNINRVIEVCLGSNIVPSYVYSYNYLPEFASPLTASGTFISNLKKYGCILPPVRGSDRGGRPWPPQNRNT
jgi:hypothetical protein